MEIRTAQRELRLPWIAQAGELGVVVFRQIGTQAFSPGIAEDRLEEIGFVSRAHGRHSLDHERPRSDVAQLCPTQHTNYRSHRCQVALAETVAVPVILPYGLVRQAL